jgi:molecular chaperone GrpE
MENKEKTNDNMDVNAEETIANTDKANENQEIKAELSPEEKLKDFEQKLAEANDKYLRLYSEFDNYRKRTLKERSELIKTAAEDVFKSLLPVIDDFERAMKANEKVEDATPIKEGVQLIYNKLKNNCQIKGLIAFETTGQTFDADIMEAITHIPASSDEQKGKVVDEVEKGYKLGDKVIRFAKVVIAQ